MRSIRIAAGLGLLVAFLGLAGCGRPPDPWADVPGGPTKVIASFPPLYCFARNVAGDDAKVLPLLTTVGPHDFHPEKLDALKLRSADLFLVNGLGLDDWVPQIVTQSHNDRLRVVQLGKAIPESQLIAAGEDEDEHEHGKEEHGKGEEEHHHHGFYDPHVWLGIPEATLMVGRIRDALKKQDPAHAADFDARAAKYVGQLQALQEHGKKALAGKKNRRIVSMHESLRYFARSFGLEVVASIQPQAGVEADAAKLARLAELCRREKVRVIAVEPQYSDATARTLGRQLQSKGAEVHIVEVDPIETADAPVSPDHYTRVMRANIDALAKNLE